MLASGYSIENIRGYASPEGPRPPGPGFQGNDKLSQQRVTAAENWVKGVRPGSFSQSYRSLPGSEFYGGPKDAELKGKKLAESSVNAFETEPAEQERRTRDVMEELEKKKTPERQTDTVWPLLRRAEIDLIRVDTDEKAVPESIKPSEAIKRLGSCPVEVIKAVADAFEPVKKP